jgi:hypothetical protein
MKNVHIRRVAKMRWLAGASGKAGVLAVGLLLAAAATLRAQNARPDPRWQAWLGCWQPEGASATAASGAERLVCVMPVPGTPDVEIATVVDAQIVSRDTVAATGAHRAISRDGCEGWESAAWASEGQRVYLHSEVTCPGGLKRSTSGLMAMTHDGQWVDAQGVVLHGEMAVHVVRYADAGLPGTVPAEIISALHGRGMAVSMAREAASAPVTLADVVEASHNLDPALIEAWLAADGQGFRLDAKKLVALSDSGVSDRVIDVMVALSYPKEFAVNPSSAADEFAPVAEARRAPAYGDSLRGGYGRGYQQPWGFYSPWGWDWVSCSPISYSCYSPYGWGYYSPFGYSPYEYAPYGYGYSPWYGGYGWNYGGGTVVIVGGGGQSASHGKLVKGRGYTQSGQSGGTGNQARPRSGDVRAEPRATSGASAPPPSRPSSSGGRTAHPRKP